jgi:predicted nucleic acid-binding protein
LQFEVIGNSAETAQAALALSQDHKISGWDALIL